MMLRAGWDFLTAKFARKKAPLIVGWAVTYRCNSRCAYCDIVDEKSSELTTEQVFSTIDEMAELGVRVLSFTGGEPLLRKDIGEIVGRAADRNIVTKLNSNGLLVKERIGDLSRLDTLCLSLDGPEEVHDSIRGRGSFRGVMEAAEAAAGKGLKLMFVAVLSSANIKSYEFVLETAARHKATAVFQPATNTALGGDKLNRLAITNGEYLEAIGKLKNSWRSLPQLGNTRMGLDHLANWPNATKMACAGGYVTCRIEPDGSVRHCGRSPNGAANCVDQGFKAAFESLGEADCSDCWCAGNVELNLLWSLKPRYLFERFFSGHRSGMTAKQSGYEKARSVDR